MGKQWKQCQTLFLGRSKITADGNCSHEIKRLLLLGRKAMTNLVKWSEVTQSGPTLCDPMDCSLQGSSVHGIFQARVLEWVAISFSRESSQLRDRTRSPALQTGALPSEPPGKPYLDSILKSRDITLPTKDCLVKAKVFPVVMYGCESWTVKDLRYKKMFSNKKDSDNEAIELSGREYGLWIYKH